MDAIDHLIEEHRLIALVVDAFERYVSRVQAGDDPPRTDLELFVRFFREFVDLGHHDKEETVLLPALVASGLHWDDGTIARIRRDHDLERYLMRSLRHAALQVDNWAPYDREHFLAIARELIAFWRAHAQREEQLLFSVAQSRLSPGTAERMGADFARLDAERTNDAAPAATGALARDLIKRYGRVG